MSSSTSVEPRVADTPEAPAPPPGNVTGRMTGLTLFTPIRPQWLPVLTIAMKMAKYVQFASRHILQFNFIHFVRWTIFRDLPYNGPPQQRERLNYSYLFFESNFDGPWQHYIDAFAYVIPKDIRFTWGRGINFPAPPPAEPLKSWIAENSMGGGHYYCAYPYASVRMVKGSLATAERFKPLVTASRSMGPDEFKAAYEQFLTDVQTTL